MAGGAAADAGLITKRQDAAPSGTVTRMPESRISSRELTADHIGQNVRIAWSHDGLSGQHMLAGELTSVTQYQGGSRATVDVGPLSIDVTLGGPMEIFLVL